MNSLNEKIFDIIGQNRPRIDARDKATGRTRYAADLMVAGCLHGKVLRSPFPHARILAVDTSKAERLPGVRAVVTHRDTPNILYGSYNSGIKDELILARKRVRFVGDEVAAVAAVDQDTALKALSLIQVEYEPLPSYCDPEKAMVNGAEAIHPVQNNVASHRVIIRGNPEAGFDSADLVLKDRFRTDLQIHAYLEPFACIADYDLRSRFHLWAPLQNPSWARIIFAEAMNLPIGRFHCVQTPIGGAFGGKLEQKLYLIAFLLARKSGKPVRLENTREEEFQTSMPRVPMIIDLKMGMRRDGLITAKEHRIIAENGAYAKYAPAVTNLGTYRIDGLYRIKNIRNECTLTYTNRPPTSAFRGFGNPQATFAVESMIDMLCHELNLDPMDVRLKNAAMPGDVTAHGFKLISCGFKPALEQINEKIEYPESRSKKKSGEGIGISGTSHVCGNRGFFPLFDGATSFVRIDEGGNVRVIVGETDVGQGLLTAFAMIVAEELGVTLGRISVDDCDTDLSAFGLGTWGDRATFIGGNAVKIAAREARKAVLDVAGEMLEAAAHDLVLQKDRAFVQGSPERSLTFEEIAAHAVYTGGGAPIMVKGTFVPDSEKADESLFGNISGTYAFGAQGCRVRVDRL
ncbi:MAG: xanthine dehydrogenase family protein, partial [Deltaproteobacteria bacterium]|nr:xanthine dehydrogenase family protein [Deltaproteobacteria bacterium]